MDGTYTTNYTHMQKTPPKYGNTHGSDKNYSLANQTRNIQNNQPPTKRANNKKPSIQIHQWARNITKGSQTPNNTAPDTPKCTWTKHHRPTTPSHNLANDAPIPRKTHDWTRTNNTRNTMRNMSTNLQNVQRQETTPKTPRHLRHTGEANKKYTTYAPAQNATIYLTLKNNEGNTLHTVVMTTTRKDH